MKSTFLTEIIDEVTIEVDGSYSETINKLRLQTGVCYVTDSNNTELLFKCSKKGEMSIENNVGKKNLLNGRAYYVIGKVLVENDKTIVKVYSIYSRFDLLSRFFAVAVYLITSLLYFIIKLKSGNPISDKNIFFALALGAFIAVISLSSTKEIHNNTSDLEIMKNEIIKRVEAIKRWED